MHGEVVLFFLFHCIENHPSQFHRTNCHANSHKVPPCLSYAPRFTKNDLFTKTHNGWPTELPEICRHSKGDRRWLRNHHYALSAARASNLHPLMLLPQANNSFCSVTAYADSLPAEILETRSLTNGRMRRAFLVLVLLVVESAACPLLLSPQQTGVADGGTQTDDRGELSRTVHCLYRNKPVAVVGGCLILIFFLQRKKKRNHAIHTISEMFPVDNITSSSAKIEGSCSIYMESSKRNQQSLLTLS